MAEQQFKVGDVVQLKSGGASMTVESVEETTATCCWLDSHRRLQRDTFSFSVLRPSIEDAPVDFAAVLADLKDQK